MVSPGYVAQINGQLILEEDYDENYQPNEEGVYQCIKLLIKCLFLFKLLKTSW